MHNAGTVARIGRKYGVLWALAGNPAAATVDAIGALEAVWRAGDTNPTGGGRGPPPAAPINHRYNPQNFSPVKIEIFFGASHGQYHGRYKTLLGKR